MLADEAGERFFELLEFPFVDEQPCEFATELGGDVVECVAQDIMPMVWISCFERFESASMFGRGQLFHERTELEVLRPNGFCFDFAGNRCGNSHVTNIIASKNGFKRNGGLCALVAGDFVIEGGDDLCGGGLSVGEI